MDRDSLVYRYVFSVEEKKFERRNNCNFHLCSPDFLSYHTCNFSCLHYRAKLAEQAERFDEMVADMKNVASQPQEVGNKAFCCSVSISCSASKESKTKTVFHCFLFFLTHSLPSKSAIFSLLHTRMSLVLVVLRGVLLLPLSKREILIKWLSSRYVLRGRNDANAKAPPVNAIA
jgi:hypothetical protein